MDGLYRTETRFNVYDILKQFIDLSAKRKRIAVENNHNISTCITSFSFGRFAGHTTTIANYAIEYDNAVIVVPRQINKNIITRKGVPHNRVIEILSNPKESFVKRYGMDETNTIFLMDDYIAFQKYYDTHLLPYIARCSPYAVVGIG